MYQILLSRLATQLSPTQNTILAAIINHSKIASRDGLIIPKNISELNEFWNGGANSINQKLPFPIPIQIENTEFAYMSLEVLIRHLFTTNRYPLPFDSFTNSPHANSICGKQLLQKSKEMLNPEEKDHLVYKIKFYLLIIF